MGGPLDGVRVIDASAVIAGPFGAALLGDFGAEVVKVEMPGQGDTSRGMGPFYKGKSLRWSTYSRNKKNITLDLRKEAGKNLFLKLVEKSDVIFENFRTGTLDKWGLDYETLKKHNPRIIVIRITGYGQTGPYAHLAGFGTPCTAFSGITALQGFPDRPPVSPPISLADYVAGLYGALAALMCLYHRDAKNGVGQEADVSLYEGLFRMLEGYISLYDKAGILTEREPCITSASSPAGAFATRDGKWVVLVCSTDRTYEYLAKAIGREETLRDARFCTNSARVKNNAAVEEEIVKPWLLTHDWKEIKEILNTAGVPISLVYTMEDAFNDPHYAARENLVEVLHPDFGSVRIPGIVPKLSQTPGAVKWGGAEMGAYNDEVFSGLLGLSRQEIGALKADGTI
ncbi:succinyl-CoA--D-citramalate CoA-transferase [Deltaproteobacteria bacterium]|nr:succinyl-CoA--D-citramalate CoA-transferase [Deltaproteobacteria bacterium]